MQRKLLRHLVVVVIALVPAVYLLIKWDSIPDVVPIHFDENFEADRYEDKDSLWHLVGIMTTTSLLSYLLLENLHRIDPKRRGKELPVVFSRLSSGMTMFLSALCLLVVMTCINEPHLFDRFLLPMMGLLFTFLGNIMYSLKPNYFAGIRIPWTLKNDDNWRRTHQFAGKVWFAAGLFMVVVGLFLPVSLTAYIILSGTVVMALLPIIYSYSIHRTTVKN